MTMAWEESEIPGKQVTAAGGNYRWEDGYCGREVNAQMGTTKCGQENVMSNLVHFSASSYLCTVIEHTGIT